MGGGSWTRSAWNDYASQTRNLSQREIFSSQMKDSMNPAKIQLRESRNSPDNPNATPIVIGLDVTGSMGFVATELAKNGLGLLFEKILDEKPVTDPHLMVMGIGDAIHDTAPLQVSQYEADIRIADQLRDLYMEGGGGGNNTESYHLPWWFVANRCQHDINARGGKGWLFTIGDELPPDTLTAREKSRVFGGFHEGNDTIAELLAAAQAKCNVYHIIATQGSYCTRNKDYVIREWRNLLGENAIVMDDHTRLPEIICDIMASAASISTPPAPHIGRVLSMD